VQEGQVHVSLKVRGEPGLERRGVCGLAFAVQVRKDGQRADEDDEVGYGDGEHDPVDEVEGPHFGGVGMGVVLRRVEGVLWPVYGMNLELDLCSEW